MATTSEMLRASINKHALGWATLRMKAKELAIEEIDRDMDRFQGGGNVSLAIAAAIITLIVQKDAACG